MSNPGMFFLNARHLFQCRTIRNHNSTKIRSCLKKKSNVECLSWHLWQVLSKHHFDRKIDPMVTVGTSIWLRNTKLKTFMPHASLNSKTPLKYLVEIITLTSTRSRNYSTDGASPGMTFNHNDIQRFPAYQPIHRQRWWCTICAFPAEQLWVTSVWTSIFLLQLPWKWELTRELGLSQKTWAIEKKGGEKASQTCLHLRLKTEHFSNEAAKLEIRYKKKWL